MDQTRKRILIVDDSQAALDTAQLVLEGAGFEVVAARSLAELVTALERPVDLVLMDVEMPEADGDQLAITMREIRQVQAPIFLFSALDEETLAARAGEAGVDGYVCKLAGADAMVTRVRAAVGEAS
jgi:DNA-binding response OmpR family regulator